MLDNRLLQAFFLLLRQGLWNRKESTGSLFPLTPEDWKQLYEMAVKQTVQAIVYDGVRLLDKEHQPPRGMLIQWTVTIDHIERKNKQHLDTLRVLAQYFTHQAPLPFLLLKGEANGSYYPQPLHRECGDIDLYFYDKSEEANRRIEALGIPVHREAYRKGSNNAEYFINGVQVEHRIRYLTLHNPFARRRLKACQNQWLTERQPGILDIQGTTVPFLPAELNQAMQLGHILKHLLTEGVGMRQCCDLACTLHGTHTSIDPAYLKQMLKTLGLYRFATVMYDLLEKHFGLPSDSIPFAERRNSDALLQEILESGNFGQQDTRNKHSDRYWVQKGYTIARICSKCYHFLQYAPGEAIWWPIELAIANLKGIK